MTDLAPSRTTGFTITREFAAPPELVWAAWTDPAQLASWFGPRGLTAPLDTIAIDPRPGGTWTITMVADGDGDGAEYPQAFTFVEVVEPERLVFTSTATLGTREVRAVITLTLRAVSAGTEMTFTVGGLPEDSAASLEQGWASSFACLAELCEGASA
jgi:uncharacterized protein YndB with AHSA1/START domain